MNIQIFGTKKCNDTKKAERFFKERGIWKTVNTWISDRCLERMELT